VRYETNPQPHSASHARNRALPLARAPLIAFQDSDDEWLPGKLERQVAVMRALPREVGVVYGPRIGVSRGGRVVRERIEVFRADEDGIHGRMLARGRNLFLQCALVRSEVFSTVGDFDASIKAAGDLDFFIRASRRFRFHHVDDWLVRCHESEDSVSSDRERLYDGFLAIYEKHRADILADEECAASFHRSLARCLATTHRAAEARAWMRRVLGSPAATADDYAWYAALLAGRRAIAAAQRTARLFRMAGLR
jgi:glycosyltransferase involved in cell wall biosynthesis